MVFSSAPIRIILLSLTAVSFVPQLSQFCSRTGSNGLHIFYVFVNSVVFTQQFSLFLMMIVDHNATPSFYTQSPPILVNYLDLAQFGVAWIGQLTILSLCLALPGSTRSAKWLVLGGYIGCLCVTLIPTFDAWRSPPSGSGNFYQNRGLLAFYFEGIHTHYVNYTITPLLVLGCVAQLNLMFRTRSKGSLNFTGVWMQALVFGLVAVSWTQRFILDEEMDARDWYETVGWPVLGYAVLATVQTLLWLLAWTIAEEQPVPGELVPLLR